MPKIALGQILVEPGAVDANLRRAEIAIAAAAERGCAAIVLPECLDLGWLDASCERLSEIIPGPRCERLAAAARTHRIHVVAGLTERDGARIYNAAILLGSDGALLLKHRKINELQFGAPHDKYAIGDRLGVASTELGCIGITICADNLAPSLALGHALGRMGAQMILSPCAWAVPPDFDPQKKRYGNEWLDPYRTLSTLYGMAVIGVSNVGPIHSGPWRGHRCIGNSLAMGPGGRVLAWGPHGIDAEALLIVDVSITPRQEQGDQIPAALRKLGYTGP